ncbi:unnamed protein product [Owenia fusiformis]|uniref:Uncharacterized protein n=1 Tax=Owenia fusiformis TaxID=6347 RepID=A0A8J1XFP0_OWEFU|nr:unnamed protein product [Owenia fusiformis]
MAAIPARYMLKPQHLENWSVKEKLALASAVLRSSEQNWVSVSRGIKALLGDTDRPADWFSQKNCALQYADLLEKVETPKRKRGEKNEHQIETPSNQIVRKLTIERIEELKRHVQHQQQQYQRQRRELEEIRTGHQDGQLQDMWDKLQSASEPVAVASTTTMEQPDLKPLVMPSGATKVLPKVGTPSKNRKGLRLLTDLPTPTIADPADIYDFHEDIEVVDDDVKPRIVSDTPKSSSSTPQHPHLLSKLLIANKTEDIPPKQQEDAVAKQPGGNATPGGQTPTSAHIPSSPSLGAPTLSKLLGTPTALTPNHKPIAIATTVTMTPPIAAPITKSDDKPTFPEVKQEIEDVQPQPDNVISQDATVKLEDDIKEEPQSPAFSIESSESTPGTGRRVRHGRSQTGGSSSSRRSTRATRKSAPDVPDGDTASHQSDLDTSDDDTVPESSDGDTSYATTPRPMSFISESVPNSPASLSQCSDTEDEKSHKMWKKAIMIVWRAAANHKFANVFMHKVTEDIAPGYNNIVHRPMDLTTIKKNIENGVIRTTSEFQRDMMLMFTNAIMYNNCDQSIYNMSKTMYDDVMQQIELYVATQVQMQSVLIADTNKPIRTLRRSDATSDKEDDSKRRRVSSEHQVESGGKTKRRKTRGTDD